MTYENFITNCENYAKNTGQIFYPEDKKQLEEFEAFCDYEGLDKNANANISKWVKFNPLVMIDQLDSLTNERIKISGTMKDKIKLTTEIKRGNEKAIILEINQYLTKILGYEPFFHEGGNHIVFKNKKTDEKFYLIEWYFALEPKENLIKKTAKELGMTYKELGEAIGYSESAISNSSRMDKPSEALQKAIMMYLENIELKKELEKFKLLKAILKED